MNDLLQRVRDKKPNWIDHAVTGVVGFSGVLVGLETAPGLTAKYGSVLELLDAAVVGIFVIELGLKVALHGKRPWRYFMDQEPRPGFHPEIVDWWHVFDFAIVLGCLAPLFVPVHLHTAFLPLLRLIRILRVVRLAEEVPQLHVLVGALLKSLPSIAYICLFMALHFYVYAAIGTTLYQASDPDHFGSVPASFLTLFEVATGNGFGQLMHDAMNRAPQFDYPWWTPVLFFSSFVVVAVTVILNLFVGVITSEMTAVKAMLAEQAQAKREAKLEEHELEILDHVVTLEKQLELIRDTLAKAKRARPAP